MGVLGECFGIEEHEAHFANVGGVFERLGGAGNGDFRRLVNRISVCPGRNGGEGDGCELQLVGNANRLAMAAGKRFRLTLLAAAPDRTDGVDDVARRQVSRGSCDCLSGGKTADAPYNLPASLEDRRPSCAMRSEEHTSEL